MKKFKFEWMVIEGINRYGIIFRGTLTGDHYIFYWNPLRVLDLFFSKRQVWFGWFPHLSKHIRWK